MMIRLLLASWLWLVTENCLWAQAQEALPLARPLTPHIQAELRLQPTAHFALKGAKLNSAATGSEYFHICVDTDELADPPAVLGEYRQVAGELLFTPRFPLSRLVTYRWQCGPRLLPQLEKTAAPTVTSPRFRLPAPPPQPASQVVAVYPSAAELPENLLKFYIHFSAPMSRGEAYQRIQLLQGDQPVSSPFLELGEELWDAEQTRFTLFIHPGRIKRGVLPREQNGPALSAGEKYTLRIDADWQDATGQGLAAPFEKQFTVVGPDHEQLNLEHWKIETPAAGTREPVTLVFDEALDHAMLSRVLQVKHRDTSTIVGAPRVVAEETKWQFVPDQPWAIGTYYIEVATNLEDLCGNSIARPFEVKMQQRAASQPSTRVAIEFIVR